MTVADHSPRSAVGGRVPSATLIGGASGPAPRSDVRGNVSRHSSVYHAPNNVPQRHTSLARSDLETIESTQPARYTMKQTGLVYDNEWAMSWTLRDGRVTKWQIYEDTARELAAHAPARV